MNMFAKYASTLKTNNYNASETPPSSEGYKKFFQPGEHEVMLGGLKKFTSKAGDAYFKWVLTGPNGEEGSIPFYRMTNPKTGSPANNSGSLYLFLCQLGILLPYTFCKESYDFMIDEACQHLTGKIIIKASYTGPHVKFIETGVFRIVDKDEKEIPHPVAGEVFNYSSYQEAKANYLASPDQGGWGQKKLSDMTFSFVKTAPDYEVCAAGQDLIAFANEMVAGKAVEAQEQVVEAPKPTPPPFKPTMKPVFDKK